MDCSHPSCQCVSFFYLAKDLRFAHHHGIQAGRNAKHVSHSLALLKFVDMRIERGGIHPKITAQKSAQIGALLGAGNYLDAIASGKHHAFVHAGLLHQAANRVRQLRLRHSQPLTHLKRRAVVVYADNVKVHGAINLCVWLKLLAAHANTAAPNANVARYAARRPRHPAFQRVYNRTMYTTHIRPESKILGSAKYLLPNRASARIEPAISPSVMKGKPQIRHLKPISSIVASAGRRDQNPFIPALVFKFRSWIRYRMLATKLKNSAEYPMRISAT